MTTIKPPPMPRHDHAFCDPEGEEPDIIVWNQQSIAARDAQWQQIVSDAVAAEREACAALCEAWGQGRQPRDAWTRIIEDDCAAAIRARPLTNHEERP